QGDEGLVGRVGGGLENVLKSCPAPPPDGHRLDNMPIAGRDYVASAWWLTFFPGLAVFVTAMSLNFMGAGLRDCLDPWLRQL
ncbi:MAG: ABC transporter permease, partial [Chloroflexota bacterium]|nr:ABC transporter permease [Chloroflexota bacterium]